MSAPTLKSPPGACDCHMHIFDSRYPLADKARRKEPDAPVSEYRKLQRRLGLERVVVVQPTAYGRDNRCTLEAVAALEEGARGIAVIDTSVTDADLERLTRAGMRGVRFRMLDVPASLPASPTAAPAHPVPDGRTLFRGTREPAEAAARNARHRAHRQVSGAGAARSSRLSLAWRARHHGSRHGLLYRACRMPLRTRMTFHRKFTFATVSIRPDPFTRSERGKSGRNPRLSEKRARPFSTAPSSGLSDST